MCSECSARAKSLRWCARSARIERGIHLMWSSRTGVLTLWGPAMTPTLPNSGVARECSYYDRVLTLGMARPLYVSAQAIFARMIVIILNAHSGGEQWQFRRTMSRPCTSTPQE